MNERNSRRSQSLDDFVCVRAYVQESMRFSVRSDEMRYRLITECVWGGMAHAVFVNSGCWGGVIL
jgi:hypothetical protein